MNDKKLLIGIHSDEYAVNEQRLNYTYPVREGGGVDLVICHLSTDGRSLEEHCAAARSAAEIMRKDAGMYVFNCESQNFVLDAVTSDGHDWANRPDGTHLLDLPKEYIDSFSGGGFAGIMYDEFEHVIANRNLSIFLESRFKKDIPAFPLADTKDPAVQGRLLDEQLAAYAEDLKAKGAPTVSGEHVFPIFFHKFAKAGIIPNFKSQKESASNIQFAAAAGAALQYGTPLWNCVDLWFRMTFPGHGVKEMYDNLLFAYLTGVNMTYVEADIAMTDGVKVNAYGREFARFTESFRGAERDYDISDYTPEIGIIRYDDGFWGQGGVPNPMWRGFLMGNPSVKISRESREWVKAFDLITHGESGGSELTWSGIRADSLRPYRSFMSMNSAAVFDDEVKKETLGSLKLCFLCGVRISAGTLAAVGELVRENGLTAVAPRRFAPEGAGKDKKAPFTEIKDGKGTWIICDDLSSAKLRKRLEPFLGNKGEMRFTFGDREIKMLISPDGRGFIRLKG